MVDIIGAPSAEATTRLSGMQKGGGEKKEEERGERSLYSLLEE